MKFQQIIFEELLKLTVVIRTNRMWKFTNRKTSCSSLDTNDPKMIDTSFESPECKLQFELSKTVRLLDF